jgi:hypothetical protein
MDDVKLPPQILEKLKQKGYYTLTAAEKIEANSKCFKLLLRSSKGDPKGEVEALKDMRGEYR